MARLGSISMLLRWGEHASTAPCTIALLSSIVPFCDLAAAFASAAFLPMNFLLGNFSAKSPSPSSLGLSSVSGPKSAILRSCSISGVQLGRHTLSSLDVGPQDDVRYERKVLCST